MRTQPANLRWDTYDDGVTVLKNVLGVEQGVSIDLQDQDYDAQQ